MGYRNHKTVYSRIDSNRYPHLLASDMETHATNHLMHKRDTAQTCSFIETTCGSTRYGEVQGPPPQTG